MATPQSTSSQDAGTGGTKKNLEQITFRFCSECSNMLYPKEDEDSHKLQFTCRTCQYSEEATSTCVFRHVLNNAAGETAGVTQDVGSDPTVGSPSPQHPSHARGTTVLCLCCGNMVMCTICGTEPATHLPFKSDIDIDIAKIDGFGNMMDNMDLDFSDLSDLSDEYEFENGMEYGNGDDYGDAMQS